jgi:toxin ParE1/3/4
MAWKVKWTRPALEDLEQTADYIASGSKYYAAAFVRDVRDAARSLKQVARRGRVVPELSDPTIRELLIGNYRLLYQLRKSEVLVIALIHGARDLGSLWTSQLSDRSEKPDL